MLSLLHEGFLESCFESWLELAPRAGFCCEWEESWWEADWGRRGAGLSSMRAPPQHVLASLGVCTVCLQP